MDRAVYEQRQQPGRPWLKAAVLGVLAVPLLLGVLIGIRILGLSAALTTILGNLLLVGITWAIDRPVARIAGGWRAAIGLERPHRYDIKPALAGFGGQLAARFVAGIIIGIVVVSLKKTGTRFGNLDAVAVSAVILAPIAEEIIFRGLVLRALMRRLPFPPAALISSVLFGALHSIQGASVLAGVILGVVTAVFGFVQCLIVRNTARLAPAMIVHGVTNALQLLIVIV